MSRNRRITYQGNHFVKSPDPLVTFVYFDQQTAAVHLICGWKKIYNFLPRFDVKKRKNLEKFGKIWKKEANKKKNTKK